jgi:hypothetical protein
MYLPSQKKKTQCTEHSTSTYTRTHQALNTLMPSLDRSKRTFNIDTAVGTKDFAYKHSS